MTLPSRGGFTLVEAIVSVTIGSIIVLLASTLFLIQNDYYNYVLERSRTQDNARSVVELVAADVRSVSAGSILVADSTRLVVRRPLAVGVICDKFWWLHSVHVPSGISGFDVGDVSGFGLRAADGSWSYTNRSWYWMYIGNFFAESLCAGEGADVSGASDEFLLFRDLEGMAGTATVVGDAVMIYQNLELEIAQSVLDTTTHALFRGTLSGTPVEFATGLAPGSNFSYRSGDTTYAFSVTGPALDSIDGVRIRALTEAIVSSGSRDDVEFSLVTDVRLRNANR